ncbi:MAG: TonB-dependent receptor plug domain-containing protein [Rikenellaceae bacterium]|nr:TonB-dependent receptor plug domain-containing protein [Rikenellaceae bacterium]
MKHLSLFAAALLWCGAAMAQEVEVPFNGRVVDYEGKGIRNVKVSLLKGEQYTRTDKQGYFAFLNVAPDDTVHLTAKNSHFDYDIPVDGKLSLQVVVMDGIIEALESQKLVDIGYEHIQANMRLTPGSSISGETLRQMGIRSIAEALERFVPGVQISSSGRDDGSGITIRGQRSINYSNKPLFLLDGMEISDISGISINDVGSIEVLKDGSIYGSRGANGVIIIKSRNR